MEYLISVALGYLLGSIPTAYFLLKKINGIDITQSGSGNVGALNSYRTTKSKWIGLLVLFIDLGKGLLSVYLISLIYPNSFIHLAITLIFAVFAHCFNPWLQFKGGKGLATAAGGSLLLFPLLIVLWLLLWVIIYIFKKNILFANIWANLMAFAIVLNSANIAVKYLSPAPGTIAEMVLFASSLLLIIFIKHLDPLKELIVDKTILKTRAEDEKK
jgi:glycerol-3-phosphate acyltransferase PlsY